MKALRMSGIILTKMQNNPYEWPFNNVIHKKPQKMFQEKFSSQFPGCIKNLLTAACNVLFCVQEWKNVGHSLHSFTELSEEIHLAT